MIVPLANYTLTYAESSKGWPSFYSFEPEYIKGMNQYLYTFKGGNMYRHNVNETRNEFYGSPYSSKITTVLNTDALTSKVFKTIQLEAQDPWKVTVNSDIQNARDIEYQWFKKKEGDWFAFVRGISTNDNFNMRSAKGLGVPLSVSGVMPTQTIVFNYPVQTPIRATSLVAPFTAGDTVYSTIDTATVAPSLVGTITSVTTTATDTTLVIDTSAGALAGATDFVFYVRNQIAESQGLLGHYCVMTLENDLTTATEMMAVKVDIMKSYP
jgi:hypothetical protein